jgi:hypothetical protein
MFVKWNLSVCSLTHSSLLIATVVRPVATAFRTRPLTLGQDRTLWFAARFEARLAASDRVKHISRGGLTEHAGLTL